MMAITHYEVRRHPRWREEPGTPVQSPGVRRLSAAQLVGIVAVVIIVTAIAVVMLKGWLMSTLRN
jgi:hypothetical protein